MRSAATMPLFTESAEKRAENLCDALTPECTNYLAGVPTSERRRRNAGDSACSTDCARRSDSRLITVRSGSGR